MERNLFSAPVSPLDGQVLEDGSSQEPDSANQGDGLGASTLPGDTPVDFLESASQESPDSRDLLEFIEFELEVAVLKGVVGLEVQLWGDAQLIDPISLLEITKYLEIALPTRIPFVAVEAVSKLHGRRRFTIFEAALVICVGAGRVIFPGPLEDELIANDILDKPGLPFFWAFVFWGPEVTSVESWFDCFEEIDESAADDSSTAQRQG